MVVKRILWLALAGTVAVSSLALAADPKPATGTAPAKSDSPAKSEEKKSDAAPKMVLAEPVHEANVVPRGQKIDWTFVVKNEGNADLEIKSAAPSCGCTVTDFDKVIKPGQSGKVTAHVDTSAFTGPIQKHVTLMTNDPQTPTASLTLNATVKPYVEAFPAGFMRYSVLQGDAQTQSVTLYSEEDQPFQIAGIDVPEGGFVKALYKKIDKDVDRAPVGKPGQAQYKIDVTVGGPTAKVGPLSDKVIIRTNSKYQPAYAINLSGVVRPTYIIMPSVLNFGEMPADNFTSEVRSITIQTNDRNTPQQFKLEKVETTIPQLTAEAKPLDQPGTYEVRVKVASGAKPGDFAGQVKITTNDKFNPVTTVAVRGSLKAAAPAAAKSAPATEKK
jgi:Protein of unknown function (DUF1573)